MTLSAAESSSIAKVACGSASRCFWVRWNIAWLHTSEKFPITDKGKSALSVGRATGRAEAKKLWRRGSLRRHRAYYCQEVRVPVRVSHVNASTSFLVAHHQGHLLLRSLSGYLLEGSCLVDSWVIGSRDVRQASCQMVYLVSHTAGRRLRR